MPSLLVAGECSSIYRNIAIFGRSFPDIFIYPCAKSSSEAIEILQTKQADAILVDLLLPPNDCFEVLTVIRNSKQTHRPLIFVHASSFNNRIMERLQDYNVVYCFIQPLSTELIIPRIMQLIRSTEMPGANSASNLNQPEYLERLSAEITQQMRSLGIPAHLKGYHFLRSAIKYSVCSNAPTTIAVTKDIYPNISLQYGTTPALVERSIRNAIEVAWMRGNIDVLHNYFGFTIDSSKGKPTNSEFIAMVADRVRQTVCS